MSKSFIGITGICGLTVILSGCMSLSNWSNTHSYADSDVHFDNISTAKALLVDGTNKSHAHVVMAKPTVIPNQHIGHYVRNMAQDLVSNMENINPKTPVAVTHFAKLDSDLTQTNLLALQIAESFMHEFHQFRIPVIDFKSTDYIRVTERGDFYLTRDHTELEPNLAIDYVITGTLVKHQGGYLVNARVISVANQQMVASAQSIIPQPIVDAITGEPKESGIAVINTAQIQ